jgi:hypothetical protein
MATRDAVIASLLRTRWPNGDYLDGVTKRTAAMLADQLITDGVVQVED